jgi:hypothetical protein
MRSGASGARGCVLRFLDVDQAEFRAVAASLHPQQDGVAQAAQGTAALDPVGGVNRLDCGLVLARAQMRHQPPQAFRLAEAAHFAVLILAQGPEASPEGNSGLDVFDAFLREVPPAPLERLFQHGDHRFRGGDPLLVLVRAESVVVAVHEVLDDMRGRHARQVGTARRGRQRQAEPDEVVRRVADDGLVEIADHDGYLAV